MRRRVLNFTVLFLCLLVVALYPNSHKVTEPRPSRPIPGPVSWDVLDWRYAEQQSAQWFAMAASRPAPVALPAKSKRSGTVGAAARYGSGACGGDLPPCSVLACESGGNLTAENPHSTASGKWQILDSTWGGYGGYSRAMYAPEEVQDERARQIYAGGAGRSAWVC